MSEPEVSKIGRVPNYKHEDGRNCIIGPDGLWRHWDHEQPEPGPRERRNYKCEREHPHIDECWTDVGVRDAPTPVIAQVMHDPHEPSDRGDFGMPTIGHMAFGPLDTIRLARKSKDTFASRPRQTGKTNEFLEGGMSIGPGHIFKMPSDEPENGLPDYTMKVSSIGVSFNFGEQGVNEDFMTDEAPVIFDLLPQLLLDFLKSNAKYALAQKHDLGVKGIVPDVNRKTSALIQRLWFDVEAGRDSTEEIIADLIGHLLLMLGKMKLEDGGGSPQDSQG